MSDAVMWRAKRGGRRRHRHAVCNAREAKRRATPSCDERREGTDGATYAVCNARKEKQWATPSCDERSEGTDGAAGTRRVQRKRSEAMSDAVM